MVLQCGCDILLMPFGPGIRTGVQSSPNLVRLWCALCVYHANNHSAELEMTVNMLIQIDKLVQLLESPVFTCTSVIISLGALLTSLQICDFNY